MQGRTEYHEKYARVAAELNEAGYDVLAVEWRGQGLSDRLIANPHLSHVAKFSDYQRDVVELVVAAQEMNLPRPWHLLAHSMGGTIGLAALGAGLPVASAVFSAPMWGINLTRPVMALAMTLSRSARKLGRGATNVPGSGGNRSFILASSFDENLLTTSPICWGRLVAEAGEWPALALGGVTHDWLHTSLTECRNLAQMPSPELPVLIAVGSREGVVSSQAIRQRADNWASANLLELVGAKHEPMMEQPKMRDQFMQAMLGHFVATS